MKSTESTVRIRKRPRTSEDVEDAAIATGGKKIRGRPRVDTQDATAADVSANPPHPFRPILEGNTASSNISNLPKLRD